MTTFTPAYRARVYQHRSLGIAETTVLTPAAGAPHSDPFQVTTLAALNGYKTYMGLPQGRRGRIDFLSKKTDVGSMQFRLLDARAGAVTDNLTRWVTAFVGDAGDLNQLGGCKVAVEENVARVAGTGAVGSFTAGAATWTTNSEAGKLVTLYNGDPAAGGTFVLETTVTSNTTTVLSFSGTATGATVAIVWTPFFTGRISSLALDGSRIWYALTCRDASESLKGDCFVGKPHSSITYAGPINLLPLGNAAPYGALAAVRPLRGSITAQDTGTSSATITIVDPDRGRLDNLITTNLRDAIGSAYVQKVNIFSSGAAGGSAPRRFSGTLRAHVKRLDTQAAGEFFVGRVAWTETVLAPITAIKPVNQVVALDIKPLAVGGMALPPNATAVEVNVYKDARLKEDNLLLINDVHPVQLFRDILDGYFGYLWSELDTADGRSLPAGISYGDPKRKVPYDSAAFTALIADATIPKFRAPIDKTLPMNKFIEQYICQPYGLGYYLDGAGRVVPVDLRHPTSLAGIPTVTNADLATDDPPGWDYDSTGAITSAVGFYYGEAFVQPLVKALDGVNADGSQTWGVFATLTKNAITSSQLEVDIWGLGRESLIDDQPFKIDAIGLRGQPGEVGLPGTTIQLDRLVWCEAVLTNLLMFPKRAFTRGPATITLKCRRTTNTAGLQPGALFVADIDELPDPATNLRGGARLLRCLERAEQGLTISVNAIDLGVTAQAVAPTIGAPSTITGDATSGAQVTVTLNASGQPAEVQYAVTDAAAGAAPADGDAAWTPAGTRSTTGVVQATGLPAARKVWFRARTFDPTGTLQPSNWVGSTSVTLASLSAPTGIGTTGLATTQVTVTWTNVDTTHRIAVYLVTPTTDPLELIAYVAPGTTRYTIMNLAAATAYKVELRVDDERGGQSTGLNTTFTTLGAGSAQTCPGGVLVITKTDLFTVT